MVTLNYYYLSYLPSLDRLDRRAPVDGPALLDLLTSGGALTRAGRMARVILLGDDLLRRESVIAGQVADPAPAVLSEKQATGEEPLPEYLAISRTEEETGSTLTDAIWAGFFTYAARVAGETGSAFLHSWVAFEVSLRNAVAEKRAETLGLDPADYRVVPERGGIDVSREIARWAEAESRNPLDGQKALDTARWEWLDENGRYFSFEDDEIAAYAARLTVAQRWWKLTEESEKRQE